MITQERAKQLAFEWFNDEHFNQFAVDGEYKAEFCLRYLMSIEWQIIAPETSGTPYEHTNKDRKQLEQLEAYFTKLCPYPFVWSKHPQYGYRVPQLLEHVPSVHGLRLPV
jgi:hypothetical protein